LAENVENQFPNENEDEVLHVNVKELPKLVNIPTVNNYTKIKKVYTTEQNQENQNTSKNSNYQNQNVDVENQNQNVDDQNQNVDDQEKNQKNLDVEENPSQNVDVEENPLSVDEDLSVDGTVLVVLDLVAHPHYYRWRGHSLN
jgi:hypothetical protein